MKFLIIMLYLALLTVNTQNSTEGFPEFLWHNTILNPDNSNKEIETKLYTIDDEEDRIDVTSFEPYFCEPIFNDNTFYIEVIKKAKDEQNSIKSEYFRLNSSSWRCIETDSNIISSYLINVHEKIAFTDTIAYCYGIGDAFDTGIWIMQFNETTHGIKSTTKIQNCE